MAVRRTHSTGLGSYYEVADTYTVCPAAFGCRTWALVSSMNMPDALNSAVPVLDSGSQAETEPSTISEPAELLAAAEAVKKGEQPHRTTVRNLLTWFGAQRRGSFIVWLIRTRLDSLGITTEPDFNSVWIDAEISFVPIAARPAELAIPTEEQLVRVEDPGLENTQAAAALVFVGGAIEDPTYRLGKLEAANKAVISVMPNHSIEQAITQMLVNGFSQLPVMQSDRDVKGIVTWESIGARLALGKTGTEVREFMTSVQVISSDKSLFAAIDIIAQHQYVLVQMPDRRISGIVTAADLSRQFQQLTEPFLLLGEIEQHIRKLIVGKFTSEELKLARDPNDAAREINNVADLTMGEYIRLLENCTYWERLGLRIDRAAFVEQLQTVRRIRNDIMHFDPDPLGANDLVSLRQFVQFMQSLRELGTF
jgi:CBS domain-containing protein